MRRDLLQLLPQGKLGEPEVVGLLKPKPKGGPVAAEPAEPNRHFRRNSRGRRQNAVERLGEARVTRRCLANSQGVGQVRRGYPLFVLRERRYHNSRSAANRR